MQVPHNAFVLVADGRKSLFFRNEGDGDYPNLKVEAAQEHLNSKDSEQKSDQAGRAASTHGGGNSPGVAGGGRHSGAGSSMGETDFHQQEEDRFAVELADMLKRRVLAHEFGTLIVVAPPKTLGELRKHYHKEVERRVAGELAKDLTGHTIPDIEEALMKA